MSRIFGRDRELGLLSKRLDEAASGKGSTVLVGGEAGVGKTRLIEECIELAKGQGGFRTMRGQCLQGSLTPYMPMMDALRNGGLEHLLTSGAVPPRVESVYLVADTGVLISKRERASGSGDSDVFTGMLTAVTQFIKDSIAQAGRSPEGDTSSIRLGDFNIVALHGKVDVRVAVAVDDVHVEPERVLQKFGHETIAR